MVVLQTKIKKSTNMKSKNVQYDRAPRWQCDECGYIYRTNKRFVCGCTWNSYLESNITQTPFLRQQNTFPMQPKPQYVMLNTHFQHEQPCPLQNLFVHTILIPPAISIKLPYGDISSLSRK